MTHRIKIIFPIIILFLFINDVSILMAQVASPRSFSLDECIQYAFDYHFDFERITMSYSRAEENLKQSKSQLLPALNFNYNYGINNGRSIDPFTNDYINQQLSFSYAGLNLDANIFNGFRQKNIIRQNQTNIAVVEMRKRALQDELKLNVTLAYLQILNTKELIQVAKQRVETTEQQVSRRRTMMEEETGNPSAYYDLKGQWQNDQMNLKQLQNNVETGKIQLAQWMNIDPKLIDDINDIESNVEIVEYIQSAEDIYQQAIKTMPSIKSRELERAAALNGLSAAESDLFPRLSFFAQLNTNYSSAAQLFTETGTDQRPTGDFVNVNNQEIPVLTNAAIFDSRKIGYVDQLQNNLSSVIGLSVQVPIFNNRQVKSAIALQKIGVEEASVEVRNAQQMLRQSIDLAYQNMVIAYDLIPLLEEQVETYTASFRINEIRFENGVTNVVEYLESKNNLENARTALINAKYEYKLRIKVLDYFK